MAIQWPASLVYKVYGVVYKSLGACPILLDITSISVPQSINNEQWVVLIYFLKRIRIASDYATPEPDRFNIKGGHHCGYLVRTSLYQLRIHILEVSNISFNVAFSNWLVLLIDAYANKNSACGDLEWTEGRGMRFLPYQFF